MNMGFSDKDKQLLYIVGAIVILAGAFFFGYRNFTEKTAAFEAQTEKYNSEYATLIEYQKKRENYIALTDSFLIAKQDMLNEFEDGYNQENFIKTVSDLEEQDVVWVSEMEFVEPVAIYQFTTVPDTYGVVNTTVMNIICDYTGAKKFLESTLSMNSKTVLDTVYMEYDEENQIFDMELSLSHFVTEGPESKGPEVEIDLPTGVDNIFDSSFVTSNSHTQGSEGSYILTDYDLSVIISQDGASNDAIIVGTTNDEKAKDSLSTDANKNTELTITVDGSAGKYTISYQLGDEKYPAKNFEKGVNFKPGDTLDLLVLSSVRADKNDKVAVKANLINKSDMQLNVLVSGDDSASPRFVAAKREGEIKIYR